MELHAERLATGDAAYITGDGLLGVQARGTSGLLVVDTPL